MAAVNRHVADTMCFHDRCFHDRRPEHDHPTGRLAVEPIESRVGRPFERVAGRPSNSRFVVTQQDQSCESRLGAAGVRVRFGRSRARVAESCLHPEASGARSRNRFAPRMPERCNAEQLAHSSIMTGLSEFLAA